MAKAKRSAAQRAATKRMLAAAAERRAMGGTAAPKRKAASKRSKVRPQREVIEARGTAMSVSHTAHPGLVLKFPAKGASDAVRLGAMEHNQRVLLKGLSTVAAEVVVHRHALMGAGLLAAHGKRRG